MTGQIPIPNGRTAAKGKLRLQVGIVFSFLFVVCLNGSFPAFAQQELKLHLSLMDTGRISLLVENAFAGDFFRVEQAPALQAPVPWTIIIGRTNLQTNFVFQRSLQSNAFYRIQSEPPLPLSVLPPPSRLHAEPVSASQVHLRWQLTSNATLYRVERQDAAGQVFRFVRSTTRSNFVDSALDASTEYRYRVRSINLNGMSFPSPEAVARTFDADAAVPLANLRLWLQADSLDGLTNGQPILKWPDISGSGNDAAQGSIFSAPQLLVREGGRSTVSFEPNSAMMGLPFFMSTFTQAEAVVCLKAKNDRQHHGLWKLGGSTFGQQPLPGYPAIVSLSAPGEIRDDFGSTRVHSIGRPPINIYEPHLYSVTAANGLLEARFNGRLGYQTTNNTFGVERRLNLLGSSAINFNGEISELLIFDKTLSYAERQTIEHYLNIRHRLQTNPPPIPGGFAVEELSGTQMFLRWDYHDQDTGTDFRVLRRSAPGGGFIEIARLRNLFAFEDRNVASGTRYEYTVIARKMGIESPAAPVRGVVSTPTDAIIPLADLRYWLNSRTLLDLPNGWPVSFWRDFASRGPPASQPVGALQPVVRRNALAGFSSVKFSGTNCLSLGNIFADLSQGEAFVLLRADNMTTTNGRPLWSIGTGNGTSYPGTNGYVVDDFGSTTARSSQPIVPDISRFHLYRVASQASGWENAVNGQQMTVVNSNNVVAFRTNALLGCRATNQPGFVGELMELLVFNRVLSSDENAGVQNYLSRKYILGFFAPATPEPLTVAFVAGTNFLTWASGGTNLSNQAGSYVVERKRLSGNAFVAVALVAGGVLTYADFVGMNGCFEYRVKSLNEYGESGYSNIAGAGCDADGDGIPDAIEALFGSNPLAPDSDRDGLPDSWELRYGLNMASSAAIDGPNGDSDEDNSPNEREFQEQTNPLHGESGVPTAVGLKVFRPLR